MKSCSWNNIPFFLKKGKWIVLYAIWGKHFCLKIPLNNLARYYCRNIHYLTLKI